MKFRVIDKKTGKEADPYEIALHEEWAQRLCYCDMEGFALLEDGTLILVDECGHFEFCDPEGFKVVFEEERPHGECKTCKNYIPYREQFSYGLHRYRGDGYCKSTITNAEGQAYINCHDEWYCANYEKAGERE